MVKVMGMPAAVILASSVKKVLPHPDVAKVAHLIDVTHGSTSMGVS
jgi:hypothetical protein